VVPNLESMHLLIFDIDGTLVRSGGRDTRCFGATYYEVYGRPFPSLDWRNFPHVTDDTLFRTAIRQHFDRDFTADERATFLERYLNKLCSARKKAPGLYQEVPGAVATIRRLRQMDDVAIGIATGGWEEPARVKLRHVGIEPDELYFAGADNRNTREQIIEHSLQQACAKIGEPQRVTYVGDAIWDVHTTRNLNMNFIGVRHREDYEVLRQAGAAYVIGNCLNFNQFLSYTNDCLPPQPV